MSDRVLTPWERTFRSIKLRCHWNKNSKYYKKGIRNFLTVEDLKWLWHRDNAQAMKRASIDRIDSKGHYELRNCRYIEHSENSGRDNRGKTHIATKEMCANISEGLKRHYAINGSHPAWNKGNKNCKEIRDGMRRRIERIKKLQALETA